MSEKFSVYEAVTNRIIDQLEQGKIPWRKPWSGILSGAHNRISGKPYSLLNQMLLSKDGEYATFNQWKSLGGTVRAKEKSEIVVFWKVLERTEYDSSNNPTIVSIPYLRYYSVFHVSQVDGVEPLEKPCIQHDPIPEAEKIKSDYVAKSHMEIRECVSNEAFYSPSMDYIQIPCREQYADINEFYGTLFHEMIHSTGHKTRLNRLESGRSAAFGGEEYSKEELVAEIGAASLLNYVGIETPETFKNSAAYIQSWLKVLKNDNRFIISASSKAEKAVEYILA